MFPDVAGNPAVQATRTLTVDTGAPSIGIDAIATDDILDASEAGSGSADHWYD